LISSKFCQLYKYIQYSIL